MQVLLESAPSPGFELGVMVAGEAAEPHPR